MDYGQMMQEVDKYFQRMYENLIKETIEEEQAYEYLHIVAKELQNTRTIDRITVIKYESLISWKIAMQESNGNGIGEKTIFCYPKQRLCKLYRKRRIFRAAGPSCLTVTHYDRHMCNQVPERITVHIAHHYEQEASSQIGESSESSPKIRKHYNIDEDMEVELVEENLTELSTTNKDLTNENLPSEKVLESSTFSNTTENNNGLTDTYLQRNIESSQYNMKYLGDEELEKGVATQIEPQYLAQVHHSPVMSTENNYTVQIHLQVGQNDTNADAEFEGQSNEQPNSGKEKQPQEIKMNTSQKEDMNPPIDDVDLEGQSTEHIEEPNSVIEKKNLEESIQ